MAKRTAPTKRKAPTPEPLGPGLHAGVIELRAGDAFRVRTVDGVGIQAMLGDGVDPGLAEECLRTSRPVLVTSTRRGVVILGALQTTRTPVHEENGTIHIEGKDVRLRAESTMTIESGPVTLRVDRAGVLRVEGDRMVVDMGELVRFLSARMELP